MTHAKISEYRESAEAATLRAKEVIKESGFSIVDDRKCVKDATGTTHTYVIRTEQTNNKWPHRKYSWSVAISNAIN